MQKYIAAIAQLDTTPPWEENIARCENYIDQAAAQGAHQRQGYDLASAIFLCAAATAAVTAAAAVESGTETFMFTLVKGGSVLRSMYRLGLDIGGALRALRFRRGLLLRVALGKSFPCAGAAAVCAAFRRGGIPVVSFVCVLVAVWFAVLRFVLLVMFIVHDPGLLQVPSDARGSGANAARCVSYRPAMVILYRAFVSKV